MNNSYPTVATILGCPEELQSADGLVATPIVLGSNNEEMEVPEPSVQQLLPSDTTQIKDPIKKALVDNILGKLPTKTTQEKFSCQLCSIVVSCRPAYLTHLSGAKHAKRLKEEELKTEVESPHIKYVEESKMYHCTLCSTILNAKIQISAHLQGTKHKIKAGIKDSNSAKSKSRNNADKNTNSISSSTDKSGALVKSSTTAASGQQLFCSICKLHTNSDQQYQQHMTSKKHLNKEKMRKSGPFGRPRFGPYYKPNHEQPARLPPYLNSYLNHKAQFFRSDSGSNHAYYRRSEMVERNSYYDEDSRDDYLPGLYGHRAYRNHPAYNAYS